MAHREKIATVFGGTGFLGKQVVHRLAARGVTVKIATRVPERADFLKTCGAVGQVVPVQCDYSDARSVHQAIKGSDFVVNCIGILVERKKRATFEHVHVDLPAVIAKACADEGISRFTHVSALGCDTGVSKYAQTKHDGENAVRANFPDAVILRPSVMFGQDDDFFNKFAELSRFMPFLPLIGGEKTRFQPVYVGDVAESVLTSLQDKKCQGKIFELGGQSIYTFKDLMKLMLTYSCRQKPFLFIPSFMATFLAKILQFMPNPLLTPDQLKRLETDNVVNKKEKGLKDLGITPTPLEAIVPSYLVCYKPRF